MQTTSSTQILDSRTSALNKAHRTLILAMTLLFLVTGFLFCSPQQAWAKSFEMPKVDIKAQVETNGSLHVVEHREFSFNGAYTCVWWELGHNLPQDATLEIANVRMARVLEGDVYSDWETLPPVVFDTLWREEGGPGTTAYSLDKAKGTLYSFFNEEDSHVVFEIDYTITNAVQAYADVAELYWQYIGSNWDENSENVTMVIELPVPANTEVVPGDNVRAWGHGPLDGNISISPDGAIDYSVSTIKSGQFGEARVAFPTGWLTNLSEQAAKAHKNERRLDTILKEEQAWADQANLQRSISLMLVVVSALLCIAGLGLALFMYVRYGKEYEPDYKDEYFRDVPDKLLHPAIIGRLWRWDHESADDFTATLIHLSQVGAIRIDKGSYTKPGLFGKEETVEDYYITRLPAADTLENPIDEEAMDVLFKVVGKRADSIWLSSIKAMADTSPEVLGNAMKDWQGVLSGQTNKQDFVEYQSEQKQGALMTSIVLLGIVMFIIAGVSEAFLPIVFFVPTAVGMGIIANYMKRRTHYGNNLVARCKALRNWLRDFSSLDERPPTDVKVWGEFMVYAYLFGVAKEAIKQLRETQPQLFEENFTDTAAVGAPWWVWYSSAYTADGGSLLSVSDALSNVSTTVFEAMSSSSSGTGSGGGFSSGGGGGFGGGGGGAR